MRTAQYWSKVQAVLIFEADIKNFLSIHKVPAECILNDPEARSETIEQVVLDELPALRLRPRRRLTYWLQLWSRRTMRFLKIVPQPQT
jgi:hypothetical protein